MRLISSSLARRSRDSSAFGLRTSVVGDLAIHFHSFLCGRKHVRDQVQFAADGRSLYLVDLQALVAPTAKGVRSNVGQQHVADLDAVDPLLPDRCHADGFPPMPRLVHGHIFLVPAERLVNRATLFDPRGERAPDFGFVFGRGDNGFRLCGAGAGCPARSCRPSLMAIWNRQTVPLLF